MGIDCLKSEEKRKDRKIRGMWDTYIVESRYNAVDGVHCGDHSVSEAHYNGNMPLIQANIKQTSQSNYIVTCYSELGIRSCYLSEFISLETRAKNALLLVVKLTNYKHANSSGSTDALSAQVYLVVNDKKINRSLAFFGLLSCNMDQYICDFRLANPFTPRFKN